MNGGRRRAMLAPPVALALALACTGELVTGGTGGGGADGGLPDELDRDRARARYRTTTQLARYVFVPGCAAENNECHSNEDFPDLHTEGNLWNLLYLPCNQGVGDRTTVEDFCERQGDQIRITGGANQGFTARIGSIALDVDGEGTFRGYLVVVDTPLPQTQADAPFEILRDGAVNPALGGGSSMAGTAGSGELTVVDGDDLPDPAAVRQGDENRNGLYGSGAGFQIHPGAPRDSYLLRRMLGRETDRQAMPLGYNSDNPTERNEPLTADERYALSSWIRCIQEGDGPYSDIHYDCEGNQGNDGTWESW